MTIQKTIPTATARLETLRAGERVVGKGLVTEKQLDALRQAPLTAEERSSARQLLGALRADARLRDPGSLTRQEKAFADAVTKEIDALPRIELAARALDAGAIDEKAHARLTAAEVGLRGRAGLLIALSATSNEVENLKKGRGSAPEPRAADLEAQLARAEGKLELLRGLAANLGGDAAMKETAQAVGALTFKTGVAATGVLSLLAVAGSVAAGAPLDVSAGLALLTNLGGAALVLFADLRFKQMTS